MLALLLVMALLVGMMPVQVGAAVETPDLVAKVLSIKQNAVSIDHVTQGSEFTLELSYTNMTNLPITELLIDFSSAKNVALQNGGTIYTDGPRTMNVSPDTKTASIPLRFTGTGSDGSIDLRFVYKKDAVLSETTTTVFIKSEAASTATSTPIDTSTYKPTLSVTVTGADWTDAGRQNVIRLLVKNTSTAYAARNVNLSLAEDNTTPFTAATFGNSLPIAEIKPGETATLDMTVTTDTYAKAGAYKLPLSLSWQNPWNDAFTASPTVTLSVGNAYTPALLVAEIGMPTPAAAAGGTFTLPVTIRNQGSLPATNVKVTLDGLSADSLMLASGSSRLSWDRIDANGTKTVNLQLKAATTLKNGSYPIGFKFEYQDARQVASTDTQQLWVPVGGSASVDSTVEVMSITSSKTTMEPGDTVSVSVVVKNTGTAEAKQVKVSAEVAADVFFPTSQNLYILKTLKAGEEKKLTFSFQAQETAKRGSTPVTVKVEVPGVGTDAGTSLSQAVGVFVNGSATGTETGKNVPKIIVYSYAAEPTLVTAGSEFDLSLSFMNTHASKTIRNIKASFTVTESSNETGSVFTPVGSSNTFYIDSIAPKGVVDKKVRLYTIPDAKSKTYNINVTFEYEDEDGNPLKSEEVIGVPVYQPARFEIAEPNYQTETQVGMAIPVSFEMYNLGKTTLFNVKMRIETEPADAAQIQPKSQYFGNYESGKTEYAEISVTPMMAGTLNGKIIVSYESASQETKEIVKEFSINVTEMMVEPTPGEVIGPDGKPVVIGPDGLPITPEAEKGFFAKLIGSLWGKIGIGVVALAVVVVVVLLIRKRRKAKQEKGLEF